MHFVIIFGPPAVGKMSVGKELANITGFKLFHNHMSIELVLTLFDYGTPEFKQLNSSIRRLIFETVSSSNLSGFIFTFVWAFNIPEDKQYVEFVSEIFRKNNWKVYFVELQCSLQERLRRNKTEERLREKPSKRSIKESEQRLLECEKKYVLNTQGDFYFPEKYIKIDNTSLSAIEVAERIKSYFNF
ncbi:MAG: AAA family ATPase [Candidatus Heimdallarchaeum aukensis]|uniref:AAA family ATPase n=1 Tax=Candidatus Heimdallarchaeum aukensis TaxID=2876573 RepID=A0A9Y1FM20_9ARCH|nr:MAG: AAA family ATPase [Candidatus Heimdallarchaeum aukensis]